MLFSYRIVYVVYAVSVLQLFASGSQTQKVPVSSRQMLASKVIGGSLGVGYASLAYTLLATRGEDVHIDERLRRELFSSISPDARVLEIGIGSGLSVNSNNYPEGVNLTGIDIIAGQDCTEAEAREANYVPVRGSAENMSIFKDHSYDVVVSTFSLCTIPHPELAIGEVSRVLKRPGGLFLAIEHILAGEKQSKGLGESMGLGLRKQQKLLTPLQTKVAHGCHLDRNTDQLLHQATENGLFREMKRLDMQLFPSKWPISSQVYCLLST